MTTLMSAEALVDERDDESDKENRPTQRIRHTRTCAKARKGGRDGGKLEIETSREARCSTTDGREGFRGRKESRMPCRVL